MHHANWIIQKTVDNGVTWRCGSGRAGVRACEEVREKLGTGKNADYAGYVERHVLSGTAGTGHTGLRDGPLDGTGQMGLAGPDGILALCRFSAKRSLGCSRKLYARRTSLAPHSILIHGELIQRQFLDQITCFNKGFEIAKITNLFKKKKHLARSLHFFNI